MTDKPEYIVHHVEEKDVTVDWFFTRWRSWRPVGQLLAMVVFWFFTVLPIVVTWSAIRYRNEPEGGWWDYSEGFEAWDVTIRILGFVTAFYVIFFLVLHLVDRFQAKRRAETVTYDEERLAQRLEIADDWYAEKFGPEEVRREQRSIRIEAYNDIETYELRNRYRTYGVE